MIEDGLEIKKLRCLVNQENPFSLHVFAGECVGITGPSGGGKTLFLRSVADMDPHEGEVYLGGVESKDISGPDWRKKIGYLPSESFWWQDRLGDHFDNMNPSWLGILGFEPDALDWRIKRLSTGERQRMALLRLLINRPEALLLDEPTANLDRENVSRMENLLDTYRRENRCPVVWVSHDINQLEKVSARRYLLTKHDLLAV
jgi:ABC-type iron transport system FetAB ATPase subunit